MPTVNIKSRVLAVIVLFLVIDVAGTAQVQIGKPSIKMHLSGAVMRSSGTVAIEQAGAVAPGEVMRYTITSSNEGMKPALGYKATGPIPASTVYVQGSAKADGAIELYSIDGGKSYSSSPTTARRQADGTMKNVPAPASMYTQIRFEWKDPVKADSSTSASYEVRVK
jgi:uncharacterized repeat protein (TIGR01451 family)